MAARAPRLSVNSSIRNDVRNNTTISSNGLSLPFLKNDTIQVKGSIAYDTSDNNVVVWNGFEWTSLSSVSNSVISESSTLSVISQTQYVFLDTLNDSITLTIPNTVFAPAGATVAQGTTLYLSLLTRNSLPATIVANSGSFTLDSFVPQRTLIYDQNMGWIPYLTNDSFAYTPDVVNLIQISPKDNIGESQFGTSVALSADGTTLAIGGPQDASGAGATWIYTQTLTGAWTEQAKLLGTGSTGLATQGDSMSLSADGNTVAIGGSSDNSNTGAVWIFTRDITTGTWTQQQAKLVGTASSPIANGEQGASVSLSADGNTLAVGGSGYNSRNGAVWIWTRSDGIWTQQTTQPLVGEGGTSPSEQGSSVALSATANVLVVGADTDNDLVGAAWIFTQSNGVWTQLGSDPLVPPIGDTNAFFGIAVAISASGNTIAIGSTGIDNDVGGTFLYDYNVSSNLYEPFSTVLNPLIGSGSSGTSIQGAAVSLSADGNSLAVAGPGDDSRGGACWLFTREGVTNPWIQQGTKVVGPGASGPLAEAAGIALSSYGNILATGGPTNNGNIGAVWVNV